MFDPCSICGKPTTISDGALPVRHARCQKKWLEELLSGPGRPVNELAAALIATREAEAHG